jgi:lipoyl(octanoyl) transferase
MDLSPFAAIDPCGYPGLRVTQMRDLGLPIPPEQVAHSVIENLDA